MRFRIREERRPYQHETKLFQVEVYDTNGEYWPFGNWKGYRREEWPREYAAFETLEQARKFIAEEKEKFRLRELERKRTEPVYHKP